MGNDLGRRHTYAKGKLDNSARTTLTVKARNSSGKGTALPFGKDKDGEKGRGIYIGPLRITMAWDTPLFASLKGIWGRGLVRKFPILLKDSLERRPCELFGRMCWRRRFRRRPFVRRFGGRAPLSVVLTPRGGTLVGTS